tara:strand:- start:9380 stop:9514 length:135 start_codon:yes stop_codon:yes gene_type:complete
MGKRQLLPKPRGFGRLDTCEVEVGASATMDAPFQFGVDVDDDGN